MMVLQNKNDRLSGQAAVASLAQSAEQQTGFDLDEMKPEDLEMPERTAPPYDLNYLQSVLSNPSLLPPAVEVKPLAGGKDFAYHIPGQKEAIRVTADAFFLASIRKVLNCGLLVHRHFQKKEI